ncbi:sugar ABC transporter substrate-binding protein (plasmid) [Deinococcus aetherius]|uniref:Sugar ABC transporter substrate-binding protein n=1 Tax=Deinococcus aetherius TaxID=200252 RepID=A0ABM8AJG9_9DEIO|nr:substrate-binding domain-containing protein [Deinococcus aetherius]BDP43963.1 sugar ABC transporter substrate-binding protein [Deinococcus aetherius]
MKKRAALGVTLLALAGLTQAQKDGQAVVGLIVKTDVNPFFVKMKEGARKSAAAAGARLMTAAGTADDDNDSQVAAIQKMVRAGAKTILITPADTQGIVPAIRAARAKGVQVIALDSTTDPKSAVDAIFATDNNKAGYLIGRYAGEMMRGKRAVVAMLDLAPGLSVGIARHNGFLKGFGIDPADPRIVCQQDTNGNKDLARTAMANCLKKNPDINVVYTINEPVAAGAYEAIKAAGDPGKVAIFSVDGGCQGVRDVRAGKITATSQQYPMRMASLGVEAAMTYTKTGKKASGYTDTSVNLIAAKSMSGLKVKDTAFGLNNCWGN